MFPEWCVDYNSRIPNVIEMQKDVDQFMAKYDKSVALKLAKDKEAGEEDEDGWVTVTKR